MCMYKYMYMVLQHTVYNVHTCTSMTDPSGNVYGVLCGSVASYVSYNNEYH